MSILKKIANFIIDNVIKATFSELDEYLPYVTLLFGLITLDASIYVTSADQIGKIFMLSLFFSLCIFTTVAVAFSLMLKLIKDHVSKNITLFEVVAFIEAKRKREALERLERKPEFIVVEEEEKEEKPSFLSRLFFWVKGKKVKKVEEVSVLQTQESEPLSIEKPVEEKKETVVAAAAVPPPP